MLLRKSSTHALDWRNDLACWVHLNVVLQLHGLRADLRFQRLLNFASGSGDQQSFADLAVLAGFADQAHMTREARRFANCTPTVLLRSAECTLRMSDLFNTGDPIPR